MKIYYITSNKNTSSQSINCYLVYTVLLSINHLTNHGFYVCSS